MRGQAFRDEIEHLGEVHRAQFVVIGIAAEQQLALIDFVGGDEPGAQAG